MLEPARQPAAPDQGLQLARAFRAWRSYNYRLYWSGLFVSQTGNWIQLVAVSWLALTLTNSPLAVGVVTALRFLPIFLVAPFAGALVDRLAKRSVMFATQAGLLTIAVALAVLAGTRTIQLAHVFVLVLLQGMVLVVDNPTRQAFLVEMVGRKDLPNAVALNSMQYQLARMLGPALGGVIIATWGTAACFALNAVSYAGIVVALLAMRVAELQPARRATGASIVGQVLEAFAFVRHAPRLLIPLALMAAVGTFGYNFNVLLPPLARDELGVGARGFGFLGAALGVGSLGAAFALAYLGRASRRLLLGAAVALGGLEVALGFSHQFWLSLAILALTGVASLFYSATTNSLLQLGAPDEMRGRIMSLYTQVFIGTSPIGGLLMGAIADRWGALTGFAVGGAITLAAALIAVAYVATRRRSALPRAPG